MNISNATELGTRDRQEDRAAFIDAADDGIFFFVADGHGGSEVSVKLHQRIPVLIGEQFAELDMQGNIFYDRPKPNITLMFEWLFSRLNAETETAYQGATLSVVHVDRDFTKATVAILGDSPVVIRCSKLGGASVLRVGPMHNARTNFRDRIEAELKGGIYFGGYLYPDELSNHGLQLTRCFGDAQFSKVLNREPEIFEAMLDESSWVLLGSDGLFDPGHEKMTEEIFNVAELIESGSNAIDLVQRAVNSETGDNATAILVRK